MPYSFATPGYLEACKEKNEHQHGSVITSDESYVDACRDEELKKSKEEAKNRKNADR